MWTVLSDAYIRMRWKGGCGLWRWAYKAWCQNLIHVHVVSVKLSWSNIKFTAFIRCCLVSRCLLLSQLILSPFDVWTYSSLNSSVSRNAPAWLAIRRCSSPLTILLCFYSEVFGGCKHIYQINFQLRTRPWAGRHLNRLHPKSDPGTCLLQLRWRQLPPRPTSRSHRWRNCWRLCLVWPYYLIHLPHRVFSV